MGRTTYPARSFLEPGCPPHLGSAWVQDCSHTRTGPQTTGAGGQGGGFLLRPLVHSTMGPSWLSLGTSVLRSLSLAGDLAALPHPGPLGDFLIPESWGSRVLFRTLYVALRECPHSLPFSWSGSQVGVEVGFQQGEAGGSTWPGGLGLSPPETCSRQCRDQGKKSGGFPRGLGFYVAMATVPTHLLGLRGALQGPGTPS